MIKRIQILISHDIKALTRHKAKWIEPLLFFSVFTFLFAVSLSFDLKQLAFLSPAIIWIAFFVTNLFTIESILTQDEFEGMLTQFKLSEIPLWELMIAKAIAIWIVTALPLILMSPFIGLMLQLSILQNVTLFLSLLIGSPALVLLGLLGSALTLSLPTGLFLGLLLLPLYVPILLLGESAMVDLLNNQYPIFQLSLLAAFSVLTMTLAPFATGSALMVTSD